MSDACCVPSKSPLAPSSAFHSTAESDELSLTPGIAHALLNRTMEANTFTSEPQLVPVLWVTLILKKWEAIGTNFYASRYKMHVFRMPWRK